MFNLLRMKKKYLTLIFILLILGTFLVLANIKLPITLITKEKISELSDNRVNLLSFNKQYFKLLPAPYIILTEPIINLETQKFISKIVTNKIEINRLFFDQEKYSILINQGLIEKLDTKFQNLKIDLSMNEFGYKLKTNKFKLDQSDVQFDLLIENQTLRSISFNISNLNFFPETL